jgi:hypothetical protein
LNFDDSSVSPVIHVLDEIFAAITDHPRLQRIAGGLQTDVYGSDNHHYVVKLKNEHGDELGTVLARAQAQRDVAEQIAAVLGSEHTIPSYYVVAGARSNTAHVLVIQPFIAHAKALRQIEYAALDQEQRDEIARQLHEIMDGALELYRKIGYMPDLNGLPPSGNAERRRLRAPHLFPLHVWHFLTRQTVLRSNNLLLRPGTPLRIVLIDYDLVHQHRWAQWIYYAVRALLFWRDRWLIRRMQRSGATMHNHKAQR